MRRGRPRPLAHPRRPPHRSATAEKILSLFHDIPQYYNSGFVHFEEIQFFVDHIAKDRISDFTCGFLKSFLIDYTIQQCTHRHPHVQGYVQVYSYSENRLKSKYVTLPVKSEKESHSSSFPSAGSAPVPGSTSTMLGQGLSQ